MPREIQDSENTTWSCVEAYAGLKSDEQTQEVKNPNETVEVICTPSGGAQTVRLKLNADWETALSDEDLLTEIEQNRE